MRFAGYGQIVVSPVDDGDANSSRHSSFAAEIGVVEDSVAEAVVDNRIKTALIPCLVNRPVLAQFLRPQDRRLEELAKLALSR